MEVALARIELSGVSVVYEEGATTGVVGIDLDVRNGELFAVVGPSGSGKTTLLRAIAGLEMITSGAIHFDEARVDRLTPRLRDVGLVAQDPAPYPHLNVFDNLAFGLRARGRPRAEVGARVAEAAGLLELDGLLDRMPRTLSGGERRRVTLGRAIARRPRVLLLDEPFSGLDAPLRSSTRARLVELQRRLGLTTLVVTHDQGEALAIGDRVAVLDRGRLAQVGTPREVYERPGSRFVAEFVGSPPMNVVSARLSFDPGATLHLGGGSVGFEAVDGVRDREWVDLGIRPEHVAFNPGSTQPGRLDLPGEAIRVEPAGHETLAWIRGGDDGPVVAARLPAWHPLRVGDRAMVGIDPGRACWFDPESGARIG